MKPSLLVIASALFGTALALVLIGISVNSETPIWCGFLLGSLGAGVLAVADR